MAVIYTQTDTAVTFEVGCSGQAAGVTTAGRELVEGGAAGSTAFDVNPDNQTEAAVLALATTGGVGVGTWAAGDYVVRLNISGANGTSQWTETHICERTAGGAFNTVASLTGQTTDISQAGIVTHTVNRGTDFTPVGTDSDLFIVIVVSNSDQHGNAKSSIVPDQNVDTPIEAGVNTVSGGVTSQDASTSGSLSITAAALGGVSAQEATTAGSVSVTASVSGGVSAQVATATGAVSNALLVKVVDSGSVGSPDVDTHTLSHTLSIGSGTNRKLAIGVGFEDSDSTPGSITSVTFDPGGADEKAATAVTNGSLFVSTGFRNFVAAYFVDIDDGVSGGTYTVEVQVGASTNSWGFGSTSLENAETGQPEAVGTTGAESVTSISPTITTVTNDAMVVEAISSGDDVALTPDDGQTKQFEAIGSDNQPVQTFRIAGSTNFVDISGSTNAGWSFASANRIAHVATSIATAVGANSLSGDVTAQAATVSGSITVDLSLSGSVQAQAATTSGAVGLTVAATGDVTAQAATTTGELDVIAGVSGGVTSQDASTAGVVEVTSAVSGDVSAQDATTTGDLGLTVAVSGAASAQDAVTDGSLTAQSSSNTVSGAVAAEAASVSGEVNLTTATIGGVSAGATSVSGSVSMIADLTGAVSAQAASVSGAVALALALSGTPQAGEASTTGSVNLTQLSVTLSLYGQRVAGACTATVTGSTVGLETVGLTSGIQVVELNNSTSAINATIVDATNHKGLFLVQNNSDSGTKPHKLTLITGTFDGTNNVATLDAPGEALAVYFNSAGNGIILSNTGNVVLSTS